jgi:transposase-like protein
VKTEFYAEICCDICHDVIHNHFNCPICKVEYAGTSIYGEMESKEEFECESCKATFKILDRSPEGWPFWELEQIV